MEEEALVDARAAEAPRHLLLLILVGFLQPWAHRVLHTLDLLPERPAAAANLRPGAYTRPLLSST